MASNLPSGESDARPALQRRGNCGFEPNRGLRRSEGCCRRAPDLSAAELLGEPPEDTLTMGAVGDIVAARVVLEDRQGVLLVQPVSVQAYHEQSLDLRQGQRRGFLYTGV
jgi:hypothetical protein